MSWKCKEGPELYLCNDDDMMEGNAGYCSGNVKKVLGCTYTIIEYDKKTIGDTGYCSGNLNNGLGIYLRDGLLVDMMKT